MKVASFPPTCSNQLADRFVPALRIGDECPAFLRSKIYVDFRREVEFTTALRELHAALLQLTPARRPRKQLFGLTKLDSTDLGASKRWRTRQMTYVAAGVFMLVVLSVVVPSVVSKLLLNGRDRAVSSTASTAAVPTPTPAVSTATSTSTSTDDLEHSGYRASPLLEPGEDYGEEVSEPYITTTPRGPIFEILGRSPTDSSMVRLGTSVGGIVEEDLKRPSLTMVGNHGPVFRGNAPLRKGDRVYVDLAKLRDETYVHYTILKRGHSPL